MKKLKINLILNIFFTSIIIFLFNYMWINFYIRNFVLSSFISIAITTFLQTTILLIKKHRNKVKNPEEDIYSYINTLILGGKTFCINFFYELLKIAHEPIKKSKYIVVKKTIIYPFFLTRKFNEEDLICIASRIPKNHKLYIYTNRIENDVFNTAKYYNFEIKIFNANETYKSLMKKYNYFPQKTQITKQKPTYQELIILALNKKRTKGYFVSSILLFFYSMITPYKLYYIIFSSILLCLSYISFSNKKFNKQIDEELNFSI